MYIDPSIFNIDFPGMVRLSPADWQNKSQVNQVWLTASVDYTHQIHDNSLIYRLIYNFNIHQAIFCLKVLELWTVRVKPSNKWRHIFLFVEPSFYNQWFIDHHLLTRCAPSNTVNQMKSNESVSILSLSEFNFHFEF